MRPPALLSYYEIFPGTGARCAGNRQRRFGAFHGPIGPLAHGSAFCFLRPLFALYARAHEPHWYLYEIVRTSAGVVR
jgi:hypothetical protein